MSFRTFLFLVIITPSVLCLSLVKLNESQKVGLPSFMYSHFNISDVSGVASVMQSFFNNFKDSISEYVDSLSGSAEVQESVPEGEDVDAEQLRNEKAEIPKNVVQVKETVKEAVNEDVEKKKEEVQQPKIVNTVEQKGKLEQNVKPLEDLKPVQKDETLTPKVPKVEQKIQNNVQKENNLNAKKLPQQNAQVNTNQPKNEPPANKLTGTKSETPSPDVIKVEELKTSQNTNQKVNVNKVNVKPVEQVSKTSSHPELFSEEAKQAATKLESFLTNLDQSLDQHLQKVRASNRALQALAQYNAAVKSAVGSKCVPPRGASHMDQVLKTCVGAVLQANKEELKKSVDAALEKVKELDYNLRLTSDLCSSLKEPPSDVCEEAKRKSLDSLNNVVSQVGMEKVNDLAVKGVGSCVEQKTEELISWTKQINDCKADGQEL